MSIHLKDFSLNQKKEVEELSKRFEVFELWDHGDMADHTSRHIGWYVCATGEIEKALCELAAQIGRRNYPPFCEEDNAAIDILHKAKQMALDGATPDAIRAMAKSLPEAPIRVIFFGYNDPCSWRNPDSVRKTYPKTTTLRQVCDEWRVFEKCHGITIRNRSVKPDEYNMTLEALHPNEYSELHIQCF